MKQSGLLVSAAASLKEAFEEIGAAFAHSGKLVPRFNFGASGTLARQIEAGASVDVFASASPTEVDDLGRKNRIVAGTRADFATNRLVLIYSLRSRLHGHGWEDAPIARMALSNPDSVPSGRYARETLQHRGLWETVRKRALLGQNVRQTLTYVANGDADMGLVFATDAQIEAKRVRVVGTAVAGRDHAPIVYPGVVVAGTTHEADARAFVTFLTSQAAQAILRRRGFGPPPTRGK